MHHEKADDEFEIQVAGHSLPLFYSHGVAHCGSIRDGITFRFGGQGCWVVSLEELRKIVAVEDRRRSERAAELRAEVDAG